MPKSRMNATVKMPNTRTNKAKAMDSVIENQSGSVEPFALALNISDTADLLSNSIAAKSFSVLAHSLKAE